MSLFQDLNEFSPLIIGLSGSSGFTNNTNSVILVSYPTTTTAFRLIEPKNMFIINTDTTSSMFITAISDSMGEKYVDRIILDPGDKWLLDTRVTIPNNSSQFILKLSSSVQTSQLVWNVSYNEIDKGNLL